MAVQMQRGKLPHIFWIDLNNDGVYTECAVMKRDGLGNVYFFELNTLDNIDKRRLARILSNRNAHSFELWDLMSNITLNNGVNALEYFHQLVKVITPGGQVMRPKAGTVGVGVGGKIDTRGADTRRDLEERAATAARLAADAAARAASDAVRNDARSAAAPQQVNESAEQPTKAAPKKKTSTAKKKTAE